VNVEAPHYEIDFGGFRVEDTILVTERRLRPHAQRDDFRPKGS